MATNASIRQWIETKGLVPSIEPQSYGKSCKRNFDGKMCR